MQMKCHSSRIWRYLPNENLKRFQMLPKHIGFHCHNGMHTAHPRNTSLKTLCFQFIQLVSLDQDSLNSKTIISLFQLPSHSGASLKNWAKIICILPCRHNHLSGAILSGAFSDSLMWYLHDWRKTILQIKNKLASSVDAIAISEI